jgi:hypothetical protein
LICSYLIAQTSSCVDSRASVLSMVVMLTPLVGLLLLWLALES